MHEPAFVGPRPMKVGDWESESLSPEGYHFAALA